MRFNRLVLTAAAAAGVAYWFKERGGLDGLSVGPRQRLALGSGLGGAVPASPPVAETMWTPADPGAPASPTGDSSFSPVSPS